MPAPQPLNADEVKRTAKTCRWPVTKPGSTTVWHCSLDFGHKCPHKLVTNGGAIKAHAVGFSS